MRHSFSSIFAAWLWRQRSRLDPRLRAAQPTALGFRQQHHERLPLLRRQPPKPDIEFFVADRLACDRSQMVGVFGLAALLAATPPARMAMGMSELEKR
jgi:hypothetical protein